MNFVVSFSQSEAETLEPQVDQLVEVHRLDEANRMFGMGTVDLELSGSREAVSAFIDAAAKLDGVHCTEQP